jgi:hypothetical protein
MRSTRLLILLHLVLNAFLLWLGYYWLGVAESRTSTLAWSAIVALIILALGCWLYGTAFVYFKGNDGLAPAWKSSVKNLLPVAVAAIVVTVIYALLALWNVYSSKPAFQIASFLTLHLRVPVKPPAVQRIFNVILWVVRWVVLPVLLLPMIAAIASEGWSGVRSIGALARRWLYWIEVPVFLVCALWVPFKLLLWIPHMHGFRMETVSFVLRAGAGYLLFVAAGLLLAFATSGGKPRLTQSSTLVSP